VRGIAEDEEDALPERSTSLGRVLLVTIVILALIALVVWFLRG